jgi:exodeoxyribonuclease VII small subunit
MATKKTDQTETFEDAFARLDIIVDKLESGDVALEESIALYAEGMKLVQLCSKKLNAAEQKIEKLTAAAQNLDEE